MSNVEVNHLSQQLENFQKQLRIREDQASKYGIDCPPYILIDIEDLRNKIKQARDELKILINESKDAILFSFNEILDKETSPSDKVLDFLKERPSIIKTLFGSGIKDVIFKPSSQLLDFVPDICIRQVIASTGKSKWHFIIISTTEIPLDINSNNPKPHIDVIMNQINSFRNKTITYLRDMRKIFPDLNGDFETTIVAGRRSQIAPTKKNQWQNYNDLVTGITIRTFDWLIDALRENLGIEE